MLKYNGSILRLPSMAIVGVPTGYPITYLADDHVSVTGNPMYFPGSEGITLDSGYDTYYRISGYDITGGSIVDGKLLPTGPCTIKAVEKVNYFTATGNFETGSNVSCIENRSQQKAAYFSNSVNIPAKYALHQGHTGDIPSSWYDTSNRWKPNDASAYSITLNTKMNITAHTTGRDQSNNFGATAQATAVSLIGSTQTQSQSFSLAGNQTNLNANWSYNKTFTSDVQNVNYGLSGKLFGQVRTYAGYAIYYGSTGTYVATGTNGTWTATGIAP